MPLINGTHVYFEGPDRCGKTSLRKAFAVYSSEQYIMFDRGIISSVAYDILYNRKLVNFTDLIDSISCNAHISLFCLVEMNPKDMAELCIKTNEPESNSMKERNISFLEKCTEETILFKCVYRLMQQYVDKKQYQNILFLSIKNTINTINNDIDAKFIEEISIEIDKVIRSRYHNFNLYNEFQTKIENI